MSMQITVNHMQYFLTQLHLIQSSDHFYGLQKLAEGHFLSYFDNYMNKNSTKCFSITRTNNTSDLIWKPVSFW